MVCCVFSAVSEHFFFIDSPFFICCCFCSSGRTSSSKFQVFKLQRKCRENAKVLPSLSPTTTPTKCLLIYSSSAHPCPLLIGSKPPVSALPYPISPPPPCPGHITIFRLSLHAYFLLCSVHIFSRTSSQQVVVGHSIHSRALLMNEHVVVMTAYRFP